MRRRKRPGEYRRRVTVDSQEQTALSAARDQRIEVGAGGKVVRQGILRERNATEYRGTPGAPRQACKSRPTLRHAWLGASPARSTRRASVPAGTSVKSGRDHGQHTGGRRLARLRPARYRATRSRGTARSARASVPPRPDTRRTANRSGSTSPNPGMPRAVSGLKDS